MRLTELEPQFLRYEKRREVVSRLKQGIDPLRGNWTDDDFEKVEDDVVYWLYADSIDQAQGIRFLCPKCFKQNGGNVGTHGVLCWSSSRGVPDDAIPKPGRWKLVGTSYNDLTLDCEPGMSRSVLLLSGCAWHGFVSQGEVIDA